MKHSFFTITVLIGAALLTGCASDFSSAGLRSSGSDPVTVSNDSPPSIESPSVPDTTSQDAITRANQQAADDASNAAAQASFTAGIIAAQETMNNANTPAYPNN